MALPRITKPFGTVGKPSPTANNYGVAGGIALTFPLSDIVGHDQLPDQKSPVKRRYVIDYNSHASASRTASGPRPLGSLPRRRRYIREEVDFSIALPPVSADASSGSYTSHSNARKSSPTFVGGSPRRSRVARDEYRVSMFKGRGDESLPHPTGDESLPPPQRPQSRHAAKTVPVTEQERESDKTESKANLSLEMNFGRVELDDTETSGTDTVIEQYTDELRFSPRTIVSTSTRGRLQTDTDPEFITGSSANVLLRYVL